MSFFKKIINSQLIDVIEWTDSTSNTMVHRYENQGKEIMMGAQLTVRESQVVVFVNEGRIADVFQPGRYELSTQNMPIMTALKSWKYGFKSPFQAEVYFVSTKQFLDRKWGTSNPVMMRDSEFGMIRLRAFGIYAFRVADPVVFLKEVFGTTEMMTVEGVEGQIKRTVVSALSDILAQSKIPALDLAANYDELGQFALNALQPRVAPLGLKLESFVVENISLPQEVEQAMDRRTSMGVVGDLGKYAQFQAAEALRDAASNEGGGAGMGAGLGAGMAMGQILQGTVAAGQQAQPAAPQNQATPCVSCGKPVPPDARFCPSCGKSQQGTPCKNCGEPVEPGAKFCPACGEAQ
ncbi:MAG: SPFH domain-containing protein [Eubacteriales bacterium]|jgi:membrane protease subunit (stomatin/prohibitin family)|nr:SPFH domain-containing protein [Eubacteriales bacterium]MDD3110648.1 SPFH domain-containing protein [Eubacteriales bacterium]MDD3572894.1 SPFH domain-containing protein [Eubacteriales bacterium]MDD4133743.1 SPFH domain-containing protein [Eubacteriales bacterium]NLO13645.1 zinc-ribbon domain-containing protein [Clostridiales bacterium]